MSESASIEEKMAGRREEEEGGENKWPPGQKRRRNERERERERKRKKERERKRRKKEKDEGSGRRKGYGGLPGRQPINERGIRERSKATNGVRDRSSAATNPRDSYPLKGRDLAQPPLPPFDLPACALGLIPLPL